MLADHQLLAALRALAGALRELDVPAMVIGGIAVIARGVPRQTVDIDAAVWGEGLDLDHLMGVLARHGLEPRIPDGGVRAAAAGVAAPSPAVRHASLNQPCLASV